MADMVTGFLIGVIFGGGCIAVFLTKWKQIQANKGKGKDDNFF